MVVGSSARPLSFHNLFALSSFIRLASCSSLHSSLGMEGTEGIVVGAFSVAEGVGTSNEREGEVTWGSGSAIMSS